jgi:alanine-alpha-ketoisovalerate/valine-pyruvate aminotransferase
MSTNLSSPEKLLSSISKVERAYNDIQGMLDEASDGTRKISPNLNSAARKALIPEISTGTGQTYSAVTTNNYSESSVNNFASSGGDESTTLEQRMLKQHTSQRTMEKRTVTMTTHSQLKSYRLNES